MKLKVNILILILSLIAGGLSFAQEGQMADPLPTGQQPATPVPQPPSVPPNPEPVGPPGDTPPSEPGGGELTELGQCIQANLNRMYPNGMCTLDPSGTDAVEIFLYIKKATDPLPYGSCITYFNIFARQCDEILRRPRW